MMIKNSTKAFFKKILSKKDCWSIGIYIGTSPTHFSPSKNIKNPVLTAQNVTDVSAEFVADPFMVLRNGVWYMFFEVLNQLNGLGVIALATSQNGFDWVYRQVVLNEPFHLSYPYVFTWNNEFYMIPETHQANSVRLYKAVNFPTQWKLSKILLDGYPYIDPSIFFHNGRWWMFTSSPANDCLRLYYSISPIEPWVEHPESPLIDNNKGIARPGGRVVLQNNQVIRYAQDCSQSYGSRVYAFHITELTTKHYREERQAGSVIGKNGFGWARSGMHTVDPHRIGCKSWIACVDGNNEKLIFK